MEEAKDLAFQTLLDVGQRTAPEVPQDLLRTIYQLQKNYQFDDSRDAAITAIQRVLDEHVDSLPIEGARS